LASAVVIAVLADAARLSAWVTGATFVGRPADAARVGFASRAGSSSSRAIDARLCDAGLGTGTSWATFLRCA
jgi:hypothetical protein